MGRGRADAIALQLLLPLLPLQLLQLLLLLLPLLLPLRWLQPLRLRLRMTGSPCLSRASAIAHGRMRAASSASTEGLQAATIRAARFQIWTPMAQLARRSKSQLLMAP